MRHCVTKGPLDCYHFENVDGLPVSIVTAIEHHLTAEEMAFHLTQAAAWFRQIAAEGKKKSRQKIAGTGG